MCGENVTQNEIIFVYINLKVYLVNWSQYYFILLSKKWMHQKQ